MRRNDKTETLGGDFVTIATKVSKVEKERINSIASAFNMSFYELLQSLLLALLRYFDSGRLVTYNHNCMMNALANTIYSLKDSYNPLQKRNRNRRNVNSAILFIDDSSKRKPQLLSIYKNNDGQMMESLNFDKMVSDFLKCIDPDALVRLESMKKELGYFSITHTLHELIMQRTSATDEIKTDVDAIFKDIRIPSGETINENIYYKRGYRKNLDEYTTITKNQSYRADL